MIRIQRPYHQMLHDEELSILRAGPIDYVDGKAVDLGPDTSLKIRCTVQPITGRDLQLVPDGDREVENLAVFTDDCRGAIMNDTVLREGVRYQVKDVEQWGGYQYLRIVRIDVGPKAN